jgi:hypothetical protein
MKKLVALITAFGLFNVGLGLNSPASAGYDEGSASHVDSKFEFPHNKWAIVRQTIQVHVSKNGASLEQLLIEIPKYVEFSAGQVDVTDDQNRSISTQSATNGSRLQIVFSTPSLAGTHLRINFNDVKRTSLAKSPLYYIFAKTVDGSESFIGEAYFPL